MVSVFRLLRNNSLQQISPVTVLLEIFFHELKRVAIKEFDSSDTVPNPSLLMCLIIVKLAGYCLVSAHYPISSGNK